MYQRNIRRGSQGQVKTKAYLPLRKAVMGFMYEFLSGLCLEVSYFYPKALSLCLLKLKQKKNCLCVQICYQAVYV